MTVLDRPLRRLVTIGGAPYVVRLTPEGVRVTPKGRRLGAEVSWEDLLSGALALDAQLAASLRRAAP